MDIVWLAEAYFFNELSEEHHILFEADFCIKARLRCDDVRGRPHGGRCWVVRRTLRIIEYESSSKALSKITIEDLKGSRVSIFGVWQHFDDGSQLRFSEMQSNLSMLGAELMHRRNDCALVVGDFNADFSRSKRYDKELNVFMERYGLTRLRSDAYVDISPYVSGPNISTIDNFLANDTALLHAANFRVIEDDLDCSDHQCTILLNGG